MNPKYPFPECETCNCHENNVFGHCSLHELQTISKDKDTSLFRKGQVIFQKGNKPHGLFCIHSGKVKVTLPSRDGREQIIRLAKGGDMIGYRALMAGQVYSETAVALEDSQICFVPAEDFKSILEQNPAVAGDMIRMLSLALGEAEETIAKLALKPVRERVAEALLLMIKVYGGSDTEFSMALSRDDLAGLVGAAKETVIRVLAEFKEAGLIKSQGSEITVLDKEGLIRVGRMYD